MRENNERMRPGDFPELQIGYPERNDVRTPTDESVRDMERFHVDLEKMELKRMSADGTIRENSGR